MKYIISDYLRGFYKGKDKSKDCIWWTANRSQAKTFDSKTEAKTEKKEKNISGKIVKLNA